MSDLNSSVVAETTLEPLLPKQTQNEISPTLRVNEKAKELIAQGHPVIHMGFGECQFPPPAGLVRALEAQAGQIEYEKVQGIPALREKIAASYNREFGYAIKAEQVVVTPGSKALLYACINQMTGDVLLPTPSWVSYRPQALYSGKRVFWIKTRFEENYMPTADELVRTFEAARSDGGDPRILVLNTPNNPTGAMLSSEQSRELANTCQRLGLSVLTDELYRRIMHPGFHFHSIGQDYPDGTVIIGGLSKDVAVGGWRLGWGIFPDTPHGRELLRAVNGLGSEIWSCAPAPMQHACVYALEENDEIVTYMKDMADFHGYRTRAVFDGFRAAGIRAPEIAGGFYVYGDFSDYRDALAAEGVRTSDELEAYILDKLHIAGLSGTAFGDDPENLCLRFSTSHLDCGTAEKSRALIQQWTQASDRETFVNESTHPELFEVVQRFSDLTRRLSSRPA